MGCIWRALTATGYLLAAWVLECYTDPRLLLSSKSNCQISIVCIRRFSPSSHIANCCLDLANVRPDKVWNVNWWQYWSTLSKASKMKCCHLVSLCWYKEGTEQSSVLFISAARVFPWLRCNHMLLVFQSTALGGRKQVSLLWNYTSLVWWWSSVRCNHINVLHTLSLMQLIKNQDAFFKKWKRQFSVSKTHALSHKCAIAIPLIHWVQAKQGKAKQWWQQSRLFTVLALHHTLYSVYNAEQCNPDSVAGKAFLLQLGFHFHMAHSYIYNLHTLLHSFHMAHSYSHPCMALSHGSLLLLQYMHKPAHQENTKHNMKYKSQN